MKYQTFSIVAGTAACNASCPYCISKMTGQAIQSTNINWINFDKSCRFAQIHNITNVIITGKGEPTLYPEQISDYLRHLKPYNFPIVELQTNAILFEKEYEKYDRYLSEWYKLGLTFISISIVDYRASKNKQVYLADRSSYINLEKLIGRLHQYGYSVRLSCTLVKGYIDSLPRIKQMIATARKWQAEHLTLRLVAAPKVSANPAVKEWTEKHTLDKTQVNIISGFLETEGHRLVTFDYGGAVYDYKNQNVCFTNALTLKPNSEDVRQIIFFPDGHLRFDWQYQGAILF